MKGALLTLLTFLSATLNYHNAEEFARRTLAVQAGQEAVRIESAKEKYALSKRFLQQFELKAYGVLAPGVKDVPPGTDIPPWAYEIDYSEIGPIVQTELKITQALTTFGKISHLIKAARKQRESAEAESERIERKVAKNLKILVVEYSSLLSLKNILKEVEEKLNKVVTKIQKEGIELSPVDVNKLKAFLHAVRARLKEVDAGLDGIEDGVHLLLGKNVNIEPLDFYPEDLTPSWLEQAEPDFQSIPEVKKLYAQVKALEELYRAKKAEYFPDIVISGKIKFSYAPLWPMEYVSCTLNPNCFSYGAGLGLRLNLNYLSTYRQVQEAYARWKAAYEALQAKIQELKIEWLKHYHSAVGLWKAYLEMADGLKFTRSNVMATMLNFDMGVIDADEIVDAYSRYVSFKTELIKKKFRLVRELTEMWYYDGKRYVP